MTLSSEEPDLQLEGVEADILAQPPKRGPLAIAALWGGLLAVIGGVVFAALFLAGERAGSPEEAVERLFAAVSDEDVLGVLEALPPSERDALSGNLSQIVEELKRLEVLARDADLGRVAGLDLAFENLELSTTSLGDDVSVVRVEGGTARYRVVPQQLPLGDLVRDLFGDELPAEPESGSEEITSEDDVQLATIKEDGRWYVSIWYSVAEAARKDAGKPVPAFGRGLEAKGASSPEAAVRQLVAAAADLDARRAFELLPPDEARALHDYAPLFLDDLEREAVETRSSLQLRVDTLDLRAKRDGDHAVVSVASLAVSGTHDGEAVAFRFDGTCSEVVLGPERQRHCPETIDKLVPFFGGFMGARVPALPNLVTVERDRRWFVSPTHSALRPVVDVLRELDRRELEDAIEGFGGLFGMWGPGGPDDRVEAAEPAPAPTRPVGDTGPRTAPPDEPVFGGYTPEELGELPPEERERVVRELLEQQGERPTSTPGARPGK
jgi:hypothetical protein